MIVRIFAIVQTNRIDFGALAAFTSETLFHKEDNSFYRKEGDVHGLSRKIS